ncbi:Phage tail collar domain containing protein [uncultured Caudovirales phage]|uniref:Phage tail collar domain containing protein n=1 Tax=uncultured Caudovirales phage TaxID=2100421 RepID=A0A6J7X239_9CAUD|nr:Phage tail collar domain containing protein [uncultured Caudovirales phage]
MGKTVGTSDLLEVWGDERLAQGAPALTTPIIATQRKGFVAGVAASNDATWAINQLGKSINHILQNGVPLWSASTTYDVGDYANHNGTLYKALNATTNSAPSGVNANWVAAALVSDLVPLSPSVGDIKITAYAAPDSGWALCNGQALSRATYAALFAKIGTTYGVGDGSTTFNLPNTLNRFIQGAGAGRPVGTVENETGTVSRDGWGASGGIPGPSNPTVLGRLMTGSGGTEVIEGLESINQAANNNVVTGIKPNNIAFHYMIRIV